MDKKTYWKDGYQLIDNSGFVYTVKGKSASCRKLGKMPDGSIDEEEYDDNLKLIHRFQRAREDVAYHEKGAAEFEANWKKANEFLAGFWKEIELLEKEGK